MLEDGKSIRGYVLREFVQKGGFGSIYRAFQNSIERDVAIKVIDESFVKNIDFIRRFEIEARTVASLEHPHIVPIYDFWREPDQAFIVMRWLEGGSIRNLFADGTTRLDRESLENLVTQIGSALQFVHERGVVHRDIKPENILIDQRGNFYLTDFGIAINTRKQTDVDSELLRIGTPEYMSPEQILNNELTFKSDLYAFAVSLFEILTLQTPFKSDTVDDILIQHVKRPFPSLHKLRPDLPLEIDDVFRKATHKSPEARYTNIIQFVDALVPHIATITSTTLISARKTPARTAPLDTIDFGANTTKTRIFDEPIKIRNPYKGLQAFDETDASDFYGREGVVEKLIQKIRASHAHTEPTFIALVGASGSGKSSVARAGLIPKLRRGAISGSQDWLYITMTPGDDPVVNLAEKLNSIAVNGHDDLAQFLYSDDASVLSLMQEMLANEQVFLLVDQFEEVFTQVEDPAIRDTFIRLIVLFATKLPQLSVIVTLRADFYDRPLDFLELGQLIQEGTVVLLPMSSAELTQAIRGPALSVGLDIQQGLLSELIADTVDQPNALPLLQFTVTELVDRSNGETLTLDMYEAMGQIHGSVANRAEQVFVALSETQQQIAKKLFLQLVVLSDSSEPVRHRILWEDAIKTDSNRHEVEAVINEFGANRLLTFDRDPTSRQPTVEVAHEALIVAWTRLQTWIAENRNDLTIHNRLAASVKDWLENQHETSFLARDIQLAQYQSIIDNPVINLHHDELSYLQASQQLSARTQRIRYGVIAILVGLTIVSVVVTLLAIDRQAEADIARQSAVEERDRANQEARISQSRALAATALSTRQQGRDALLLAVGAVGIADTYESFDSLVRIIKDHQWVTSYVNRDLAFRDMLIDASNDVVFAVGESSQILQWEIDTPTMTVATSIDGLSVINAIALHDDGVTLAVGGANGVAVYDTGTDTVTNSLELTAEVWAVGFARGERVVYAVDDTGKVTAWDYDGDEIVFQVAISEQSLFGLAVHPAGTEIAVGGADNLIYVLDAINGGTLYRSEGHSNWILSLDYAHSGRFLASSSADLSVIVWDMESRQPLGQILTQHTDWVRDVEFSPDDSEFLTASADGTLKRWNVANGRQIGVTLARHGTQVWSANYLSGQEIVSADLSGELIHWDLENIYFPMIEQTATGLEVVDAELAEAKGQIAVAGSVGGQDASIQLFDLEAKTLTEEILLPSFTTDIDYSRDGKWLAVAGIDQMIRLIQMEGDYPTRLLGAHESIILSVAFAPDRLILFSGDDSGLVKRWDVEEESAIGEPLDTGQSGVQIIHFSQDGRYMLTGGRDGSIGVWDAESLEAVAMLTGGHRDAVLQLLLSADGKMLYSVGRDSKVVVWDMENYSLSGSFPMVHTDWIMDVKFLNDNTLLTIGRDSLLVIWDIDRRQAIGIPLNAPTSDWGVVILPDGNGNIYTVYRDGLIGEWELDIQAWMGQACSIANVLTIPDSIAHLINRDTMACIQSIS